MHEMRPKSLFAEFPGKKPAKITVCWMSNNDDTPGNRSAHLKTFLRVEKRVVQLNINTCQLVDDLLSALDSFFGDARSIRKLKRECERRYAEKTKPQSVSTKGLADIVKDQIWKARFSISRRVEERGRPA